MGWDGNRDGERFTFRRIIWPSFEEAEDYWQITGGSIELSSLTDLKASGSFTFDGEAPDDHDLMAVSYSFDDGHDDYTLPLATFRIDASETANEEGNVSGTVKAYSTLQFLSDTGPTGLYVAPSGCNPVQLAKQICESLGLRVNNPDPSGVTLSSCHAFDPKDDWLTIVNWLLGAAGFSSAKADPFGTVVMGRYEEPTERTPSVVFRDDEHGIMLPRLTKRSDYKDTPNFVELWHDTDEVSVCAWAKNTDPDSKASTVSRGCEKKLKESVGELSGDTPEEMLANLKDMAESKLVDNSAEIEYVVIDHAGIPVLPGDSVKVEYMEAGIEWTGSVTNLKIGIEPSMPTQLTARKFIRKAFVTETGGEVVYEA